MTTDDRHNAFGQMLRKGVTESVPQGLQEAIMQKVTDVEHRRMYRRLAFMFAMRSAAVLVLLILLIKLFLPRIDKVDPSAKIAAVSEKLSEGGFWLFNHLYFMLVPVVLLFLYRLLRVRSDY